MTALEKLQAHTCTAVRQKRTLAQRLLAAQTGGISRNQILGFTWVGRGNSTSWNVRRYKYFLVGRTTVGLKNSRACLLLLRSSISAFSTTGCPHAYRALCEGWAGVNQAVCTRNYSQPNPPSWERQVYPKAVLDTNPAFPKNAIGRHLIATDSLHFQRCLGIWQTLQSPVTSVVYIHCPTCVRLI